MATNNDIGKRIYVAAGVPATNNAAGFEALTWVRARYHQTLPQLGITHSDIDVEDMETGFTKGVKGAAQGVTTQITFRIENTDRDDPGQIIVKTQSQDEEGTISVKIVDGTGADNAPQAGDLVQYAQGYLKDYQPNQGTVTSHEGFSASFRQNDFTVEAVEPV